MAAGAGTPPARWRGWKSLNDPRPRLALHELTEDDAPFILELLMSRGFRENIGDRGVR